MTRSLTTGSRASPLWPGDIWAGQAILGEAEPRFRGNTAAGAGGAIFVYSIGTGIVDSTFRGNTAVTGGALALYDEGPAITGTVIQRNRATGNGGGIISSPGGTTTSLSLADSTVSGNRAGARGGGVYNQGALAASGTRITRDRAAGGGRDLRRRHRSHGDADEVVPGPQQAGQLRAAGSITGRTR